MGRFIGIRHRVKRTKEGEARPTTTAIIDGDKLAEHKLADETEELDFVFGQFPIKYRGVVDGEALDQFIQRQLKKRKNKETKQEDVTHVPIEFDGLKAGDTVAMSLGGSGDYFAHALTRQAMKIGARVLRLPPSRLKEARGEGDKDRDHILLAELGRDKSELFQEVTPRDLPLIELRIALRARQDAQKDRIACEQRLFDRLKGQTFIRAGEAPERTLEDEFLAEKATDKILQALVEQEEARTSELKRIVHELAVWQKVFEPIKGCGEMIASRIIGSVGDVRRFPTKAKLKRFCGVHCTADGKFARRRHGEVANWHPDARQALWLLADQFNRRPDSEWGQKLREYKAKFRVAHPEVLVVTNGDGKEKKKYTDGHIHKMALWRTVTKFVERLWKDWTALESAA